VLRWILLIRSRVLLMTAFLFAAVCAVALPANRSTNTADTAATRDGSYSFVFSPQGPGNLLRLPRSSSARGRC